MTSYIITTSNFAFFESLQQFLKEKKYENCLLISDENIFAHYGTMVLNSCLEHIPTQTVILKPGESNKTIETANHCWNMMYEKGLSRHSLILALGGGVVTDLSGFVAACYMRGIDTLYIPTTLIGMADASIGGKTAVNLPNGKNIIGVIRQPSLVIIHPDFLLTLPKREYRSGLAEIIKYGIGFDSHLLHFFEKNIPKILQHDKNVLLQLLKTCCEIKNQIVKEDELDQNKRMNLNWGHTFAHAIEAMTHYTQFLHGEAVAIGMSCAAHLSKHLSFVDQSFVEYQDALCNKVGLPTDLPPINIQELVTTMKKDKKKTGSNLTLILSKGLHSLFKHNVDESDVAAALTQKAKSVIA